MTEQTEPTETIAQLVASRLRDVPDFPEPGVSFKDFTPLLATARPCGPWSRTSPTRRARQRRPRRRHRGPRLHPRRGRGLRARHRLRPGPQGRQAAGRRRCTSTYELEYGTATIEVHADAFVAGARVLLVDDVLATGGTAVATCDLLERAGAKVVAFEAVVELGFLRGRERLAGPLTVHTDAVTL